MYRKKSKMLYRKNSKKILYLKYLNKTDILKIFENKFQKYSKTKNIENLGKSEIWKIFEKVIH